MLSRDSQSSGHGRGAITWNCAGTVLPTQGRGQEEADGRSLNRQNNSRSTGVWVLSVEEGFAGCPFKFVSPGAWL